MRWRDAAPGPNQPENALLGGMYAGDNDGQYFHWSSARRRGRTDLAQHAGRKPRRPDRRPRSAPAWSVGVGQAFRDGLEPAGVITLRDSPVTAASSSGRQPDHGQHRRQRDEVHGAQRRLGLRQWTNFWSRGLALDGEGAGQPNLADPAR